MYTLCTFGDYVHSDVHIHYTHWRLSKPMLIVAIPWAPGRELALGHWAFARDLSMSTGSKEMTIKYWDICSINAIMKATNKNCTLK